jgi:hypothetical protein
MRLIVATNNGGIFLCLAIQVSMGRRGCLYGGSVSKMARNKSLKSAFRKSAAHLRDSRRKIWLACTRGTPEWQTQQT